MSKRWLIILLLISVAFNMAVLGSMLFLHFNRPCSIPGMRMDPPPGPPPMFGKFNKGHWGMESDSLRAMRERFGKTKKELMIELAKDPVDEARVKQIINSTLEAQAALERDLGNKLLEMRRGMTAAEAKEHFNAMRERMEMRKQLKNIKAHRRQFR